MIHFSIYTQYGYQMKALEFGVFRFFIYKKRIKRYDQVTKKVVIFGNVIYCIYQNKNLKNALLW